MIVPNSCSSFSYWFFLFGFRCRSGRTRKPWRSLDQEAGKSGHARRGDRNKYFLFSRNIDSLFCKMNSTQEGGETDVLEKRGNTKKVNKFIPEKFFFFINLIFRKGISSHGRDSGYPHWGFSHALGHPRRAEREERSPAQIWQQQRVRRGPQW